MLHPATELRWTSPAIGWGVFATALIPRGTITWVQDPLDQVFSPSRVGRLPAPLLDALDRYSYVNGLGERVLCWDHARYINHHCVPTVLSPGFEFDVALRNIAPGEEITTDYGSLNLDAPFDCACGAATCRRQIRPDDPDRLIAGWDRRVRQAFHRIGEVAQALWALLPDPDDVQRVLAHDAPVPSIASHRCPLPPALLAVPRPVAARRRRARRR